MVDCGMRQVLVAMCLAPWLVGSGMAWGLEFSADQITRIDGHSRKVYMYYRDDRWRLEHHDLNPVNVTIVRKDKHVMWLLLSRMRHFKTVPYDPEQAPKVAEKLPGEVNREEIGTEMLDGHPTTLYQVTVWNAGRSDVYYQWLATDIHFPLRLARKDGGWVVEYRNVKLRPISDFLFELPVNFQPLEEFDQEPARNQQRPM